MLKYCFNWRNFMNLQELFNSKFTYKDGKLYSRRTNLETGKTKAGKYYTVQLGSSRDGTKKTYRTHRVIWIMHYGDIPDDMMIDHKDGDTHNNLIENLRLATFQENIANRPELSKNGLPKGVRQVGNRFQARIRINGTAISLGGFNTPEEAGEAYKAAAETLHGEFAYHLRGTAV